MKTNSGISIRKRATGEMVTVTYDGHTTGIILDDVSMYNKTQYLSALVMWALEGYKGFPPTLKT